MHTKLTFSLTGIFITTYLMLLNATDHTELIWVKDFILLGTFALVCILLYDSITNLEKKFIEFITRKTSDKELHAKES